MGDINLGTDFPLENLPPEEGVPLFSDCAGLLRKADIAFGNLEGVFCDRGRTAKNVGSPNVFAFKTPVRYVEALSAAGFDVLSLANNHVRDFGKDGEQATREALDDAGIRYATLDGEVADFYVKGARVGFVAFSFAGGARSICNEKAVFKEINAISGRFDILVVSFHCGAEGNGAVRVKNQTEFFCNENRGNPVILGHGAIDNGADLVLMHGPHVPRAMEFYKGKVIAYSLGNFVNFGWSLHGAAKLAPLLWFELDRTGNVLKCIFYSFVQNRPGYPQSDETCAAYNFVKELTQNDFSGGNIQFMK